MVIQKLDIIKDSENCVDAFGDTHNVAGCNVIKKVNELVGVVNELVLCEQARTCHELIHKDKIKDPFAKQRKWIGKLCRFWNEDTKPIFSILDHIQPYFSDAPFVDRFTTTHWQHCEPVKPNDDVIFKGE